MEQLPFQPRSSLAITYSVWKALFLREAVARISASRTAWIWLLVEPAVHIAFLLYVFIAIRLRHVGGIDTMIWLMVGLLTFFMFRRTAVQAKNAIDANQALFGYRQVFPVDTVLVRAVLEGFLMLIISLLLFSVVALLGHDVMPADPLAVVEAVFAMWLIGVGFGMCLSVVNELLPEVGKVLDMLMMPMYLISGVIFPIGAVPPPYRDYLLLNPLVHGLEAARLGFSPYYHAIPELDIGYLYGCALVILFFGFALQRRFAARLVTR